MAKEQYEKEMNLWLKYFHALMQLRLLLLETIALKEQINLIENQEGKNICQN